MSQTPNVREIKLVPIGNSKGVRLPKALLDKYGWSDRLLLEEKEESIILRSERTHYLSWEETFRAMADESEDWSDFDTTIADGLD